MKRVISAALSLLLVNWGLYASNAIGASLPPGAVPMSPGELYNMYSGKTQTWPVDLGGWYFAPDRRLSGYTREGSYAAGRWYITESGKVCVEARWRWAQGPRGRGPVKKTCWEHRKVGNQIWKANVEKGNWFHWNARDGESKNFTRGYKYGQQVNELHARLGS